MWFRALVILVIAACTRRNPLACPDGNCSDPDYPFCDTDGSIAGLANACIAVDCTPMQFIACRGTTSLRCNATGDNYDITQCETECELGGCKPPQGTVCDPWAPFDLPVALPGLATPRNEPHAQLSQDELTVYIGASLEMITICMLPRVALGTRCSARRCR